MTYTVVLSEGTRRARKVHKCFDCYRSIEHGSEYAFQTCKSDYVYTITQHMDCLALGEAYRAVCGSDVADYEDGFPPLKDEWIDSGEFSKLCDSYRREFPHAVARMESGSE